MRKKTENLTLRILLLIIIFSFQFSPLIAQNEVPDSLVTERLQFLKSSIERDKVQTQRWWYGWLATYSAATIAQGAVYFASNEKNLRQDMVLGAATTILGTAGQFISPFKPSKEPNQFYNFSENTSAERLRKLAIAEVLLEESATREKLALTWQNHILCTTVNVAGGLITWLAFEDRAGNPRTVWDGIANFALNTVITEAQIWSQPTLAKRNYKKYCQRYLQTENGLSAVPEVKWYIEARPSGIGIKVMF